jgi:di/tripeptidase
LIMAAKFIQMLPQNEAPETTDGKQGYYWSRTSTYYPTKVSLVVNLKDFEE